MGFDLGRIILDSDNGTYYSGQMVYGKLVFDEDRVKPMRGLYVKMKGYCNVHWTTSHQRRNNERNEQYTVDHNAHEVYFEVKHYLVGGETGEHHLNAGSHEFPFQFQIPFSCPSSYEGSFGHIRYEVKAVMDKPFKLNEEKKAVIRVIAPCDLNADPYCREPIQFAMYKSYCCWCINSGSSETIVKLPAAGFCPGQEVPIEIACTNNSSVEIKNIKLSMIKNIMYRATDNETKKEDYKVVEIVKGPVAGNGSRNWTVDFKVPVVDACNLANCRFIDIDFELKVTVEPEGCHTSSEESTRIVIGNVPLAGFENKCVNSLRDLMPNVPVPVQEAYHTAPNVVSQVPIISTVNQPLNTGYPHPGVHPQTAVPPYPVYPPPYSAPASVYPGANPYQTGGPVSEVNNTPYNPQFL